MLALHMLAVLFEKERKKEHKFGGIVTRRRNVFKLASDRDLGPCDSLVAWLHVKCVNSKGK